MLSIRDFFVDFEIKLIISKAFKCLKLVLK